MPWTSVSPIGSISVKANRTTMNGNTTYIETTMGNSIVGTNTTSTRDHFWNVGSDEDGRHRFIQSPGFTVGGAATDPVVGTGMDGVMYLKEVNSDVARVEGFYRNAQGIYQFIPTFLSGSGVSITSTSTFSTIATVPSNVYGEIFMYNGTLATNISTQWGFFQSNATGVVTFAVKSILTSLTSSGSALEFYNLLESTFDILSRRSEAPSSANWNYRITYRAK